MDLVPSAQRTCLAHKVALDPSGHCIVCRRAEAPREWDPSGVRGAVTALVALAIVAGGVLLHKRTTALPPPPVVEAAPAAPPLAPAPAPAIEDLGAADDQARTARLARESEERRVALEREMKRVPIRIYTARWCELCRTATAFLESKKLVYDEVDVEASPETLAELRAQNPKSTVPTLVIGEEVIVGFGPSVVMSAVVRAANKKVR